MEQKFDAALPYERREKLRASRRRQWCQPFLKSPSAREHFRLLPTRAEDESRGLPRPFPTLCAHVTYPVRKGSWECATRAKGAKGDTGLQGSKGQKGSQGASGNNGFGVAGGTHYRQTGGGTNYQCLPTDPQWGRYQNGVHGTSAYMYGAQYRIDTNVPFGSTYLDAHDVPCAVCYVQARGSKLTIPARKNCYSGWTEEYDGYLMANLHSLESATEYVCVDDNPETVPGGQANQASARFYPVEARCGSLPCPNYVEGRELTCVVCTK
ncbi:hypothetical protein Bbelb_258360 [Branchiostoma belcheri]|nr:hypothetical protein Bbelb_258360 [Branchiostoma belcheri]